MNRRQFIKRSAISSGLIFVPKGFGQPFTVNDTAFVSPVIPSTGGGGSPTPSLRYKFNDGSGSSVADSSGNANTGTLTVTSGASSSWVTGQNGTGALSLQANVSPSAYVNSANKTGINFDRTDSFSVSLWVKWSVVASSHILVSTLDASSDFRGWELNYGDVVSGELNLYLISAFSSGNKLEVPFLGFTPTVGVWYNICLTYDGSSSASGVVCYINGSALANDTPVGTLSGTIANAIPLYIGARPNGTQGINAVFDDLQIFPAKLTSGQAAAIFAANAQ